MSAQNILFNYGLHTTIKYDMTPKTAILVITKVLVIKTSTYECIIVKNGARPGCPESWTFLAIQNVLVFFPWLLKANKTRHLLNRATA